MAPLAGGFMLSLLAVLANPLPAAAVLPPTAPVHVVSWSQWGPDDALGQYHVVGEVRNDDNPPASQIRVTASGPGVLETVEADAEILAKGELSPFNVPLSVACSPCTVSVTWASTTAPPNHKFTVSTNAPTTDPNGTQFITGTVTNNNKTASDYVRVLFTFYDALHRVVDTDQIPLNNNATDTLDAGDSASFELVRDAANPGWSLKAVMAESSSPPSLPIVSPTPVPLDAGGVAIGDSTSASLTVNNTGNDDLDVSHLGLGGPNASDYALDWNNCGGPVVPGDSCVIAIDFTPTAPGTRAATLSLTDEAADSPQAIALTGEGLAAAASVLSAVAFGDVVKGAQPTKNVTVTNSGTLPLHVDISQTGISTGSSDFSADPSGCTAAIAPQHSCIIPVTFAPAVALGDESATLAVFDDAFNSPEQDVPLSAASTDPILTVSPTSLAFSQGVLGSSAQKTVTVTNTPGKGNLHVGSVSVTGAHAGDFTLQDGCSGQAVAPSGTCLVGIVFTPQAAGDRGATLVVTADATNSPKSVTISAIGTGAALSPSSFDFGSKNVGATSTPQSFTLTNASSQSLTISGVTVSGDFAKTNASTCSTGFQVTAVSPCTVVVTFKPSTTGPRTGMLTIDISSPSSRQTASLSGSGVAVTAGWNRSPANMTSSPAIAASGGGRLDAFARGRDMALYQVSSIDGGTNWGNWSRIPGALSESPAAVSSAGGRTDVFVRGTDLALYHRFRTNAAAPWSNWEYIRARMSSAPAVASLGAGKLIVVARGQDLALYVITSDGSGTGWGQWQR